MLFKGSACPSVFYAMKRREHSLFIYVHTRQPGGRSSFSMLLYRSFAVINIAAVKSFGKPAVFICDAEKYTLATAGTDHDTRAWNPFSRQSLYIPIRS